MSIGSRQGKILVLGNDCRSFLTVIRSLGRAGLTVHTAWAPAGHAALRSRYVSRHHDLPLPRFLQAVPEPGALPPSIAAIGELMDRESFDLVVPCNDESILPLRAYRDRLPPGASIYLLNEPAHAVSISKAKTHELARSLDIPVPHSERVSRIDDLQRPVGQYPLPVVIKPISSFDTIDLAARRSVAKVFRHDLLLPALERALVDGPVLIQENVLGSGVGVEILADHGQLRVAFQHQRVHEPLHGGGSSYRRSVVPDPALLDATARLAAATGYHGVGMFEFKQDLRTRRWVLIEINGRFWGSLPLAVAAGADFPLFLYEMLIEGRTTFPQGFRTGLYCRNLLGDLEWLRDNLPADKHDPTLATRSLGQITGEFWNAVLGRERIDTITLDDPRPGLAELWGWFGKLLRSFPARLRGRLERTGIGRRILRDRLRRALGGARSVAFVCHGNICRSPFAARLAHQLAGESWAVLEGGTGVRPGLPPRSSPAVARRVADQYGVDLSDHRAQAAAPDLLREADVLFVFDERNRRELRKLVPGVDSRIHFLGAGLDSGPLMIGDPDGGDQIEFEQAYRQIASALAKIIPASSGSTTKGRSGPAGH